ncbi:FmdB family zinc ribbon protein [Pseudactinotalea sp. Z1748]|uniref:FmdB family zinc ribbon protein n=1 Tax=Pseudactinotalea sp. Z1748 TaxID=3413027 RepID=UPI003C7C19A8
MPNYSYACTECGHAFDIYQAFSDDALTECPQCQGVLRKKFSAVGVVFKGSGFYRNDARGSSSTTESGAAKGTGKDGDSKPAAAKESTSNGKAADGGSSSSSGGDSSTSTTAKKTPAKAGAST